MKKVVYVVTRNYIPYCYEERQTFIDSAFLDVEKAQQRRDIVQEEMMNDLEQRNGLSDIEISVLEE